MICSKCGKEIPDYSIFCPICGEKQSKETAASPEKESSDGENLFQPDGLSNKIGAQPKSKKNPSIVTIAVILITIFIAIGVGVIIAFPNANSKSNTSEAEEHIPEKDPLEVLATADQYMSIGEYDKALELYESIDLETARTKAKAIRCIPIANSLIDKFYSEDEVRVSTKITADLFSYSYEYYYDVENYKFHLKVYVSDMVDTLRSQYGQWSSFGAKSVDIKTKEAFETFLNAGFEDIVCVEDAYSHGGAYRASAYYDIDAYHKYPPENSTSTGNSNLYDQNNSYTADNTSDAETHPVEYSEETDKPIYDPSPRETLFTDLTWEDIHTSYDFVGAWSGVSDDPAQQNVTIHIGCDSNGDLFYNISGILLFDTGSIYGTTFDVGDPAVQTEPDPEAVYFAMYVESWNQRVRAEYNGTVYTCNFIYRE